MDDFEESHDVGRTEEMSTDGRRGREVADDLVMFRVDVLLAIIACDARSSSPKTSFFNAMPKTA